MALTREDISDGIKVFDIIECPLCGFNNFVDYGPGGGVLCDECGTQFKVRGTGGDAGCVVDATFGDVHNITGVAGLRSYRRALTDLEFYVDVRSSDKEPVWTAIRIMKCPDEYGQSLDDRGWSLCATRYHPDKSSQEVAHKYQETLVAPIVGRYQAKLVGEKVESEKSEAEFQRKRAAKKRAEEAGEAVH